MPTRSEYPFDPSYLPERRAVPYDEIEAIMSAAPHEEVLTSRTENLPLGELLGDTMDSVLTDRERWIVDACVIRRMPVREAAHVLSIGKTELCRLRDGALLKLQLALTGDPLVDTHLNHKLDPTTWEEAAAEAASLLKRGLRQRLWLDQEQLVAELRHIINETNAISPPAFAVIGSIAHEGLTRAVGHVNIDDIVRLIISKQHDYGHQNIALFGELGLLVRMSDKVARIENLLKRSVDAHNEPIMDSWADLIGYSLIGLMWQAGTFMLPLEVDKDGMPS